MNKKFNEIYEKSIKEPENFWKDAIKKLKFKKIYVIKIPNKGPGVAINDRLNRAAKRL